MSLTLLPRPKFSGTEGRSLYHFPYAVIEVKFKESLLTFGVLRTGGGQNAAAAAEIWVWSACGRMLAAFPFSPNGQPLHLATLDQLTSLMVWARDLVGHPARMSTEKS